jgi:hypothetical protein
VVEAKRREEKSSNDATKTEVLRRSESEEE